MGEKELFCFVDAQADLLMFCLLYSFYKNKQNYYFELLLEVVKIVKYLWVIVHWTVRVYFMALNFRDIGGKDILTWTQDCLSVLEWQPFQSCFPKSQTLSNKAGLGILQSNYNLFFYFL